MSTLNRYSKTLAGLNASIFVSPAVAYTTDASPADFLANAVEGEIGVYLADGTLQTTALAAGDEFNILQKKDGEISQTPLLKFNDITRKILTDYTAPVKQITSVGYSRAAATGSLNIDLSIPGTQELAVAARITTPGNQPFPVEEGRSISTRTTDTEYGKIRELVNDMNNIFDYQKNQGEPVVVVSIQSDGNQAAIGVTTLAIAKGSDIATYSAAHGLSVGDFVSINGRNFRVRTVTSATVVVLDAPYTGDSVTALATGTSATTHGTITHTDGTTELGILIEGVDTDTHFSVTVLGELETATITKDQDWLLGSGDGDSVIRLEEEGVIFAGLGSTVNAPFKEDYGQPTKFASITGQYDLFFIELFPSKVSVGLPVAETKLEQNIIIAAPESGTSPTAALATIFAV